MKKSYEVLNIKCNGCASRVKQSLSKRFDDVDVDLTKMPRIVTVDIKNDEDEEFLNTTLKSLGYPFSSDDTSSLEKVSLKAKSFVSCAIGKMSQD
jgi:copper chaperone CopZ